MRNFGHNGSELNEKIFLWTVVPVLNINRLCCETLEIFFHFLHKKRVKMKLFKIFELYELQWSRLLHFRSGREATGGLEKKEEKIAGAGMGYCPFYKIKS